MFSCTKKENTCYFIYLTYHSLKFQIPSFQPLPFASWILLLRCHGYRTTTGAMLSDNTSSQIRRTLRLIETSDETFPISREPRMPSSLSKKIFIFN